MESQFSLVDKKIIITGASSGIGRQCSIIFSNFGAEIIMIGRNQEGLSETYSNLKPGNHSTFISDITNFDNIEMIVPEIVSKCGKINGFVHSAGIELTYPLNNMNASLYNKVFSINVIAGFELAKQLSKSKYVSSEGASFVFISSIMGVVGNSSLVAYSASKGALISGVKSMAIELSGKKIRVNSISPGYLNDTPLTMKRFSNMTEEQVNNIEKQHPLGFGKSTDVANSCLFLLSDASRWITGINLVVDGGYCAK